MLSVSEFVAEIQAYNSVLNEHGLKLCGTGVNSWTNRHTNATMHVDIRKTGWTAYDLHDNELASGTTPEALRIFLRRH